MVTAAMVTGRVFRALTAAVSATVLAGCGAATAAVIAPPGATRTPCGTVSIAVNPWAGFAADVAVVSYLLRRELGCTVTERNLTEDESWAGLARGDIDVILENWGHDDLKKRYIDDRKVAVEQGLTGSKGVIGWYLPPWMAEKYPDIADWTKLNKYATVFRTAESGGKGQFLAGDPSFVTNDAALIRNLKLDFTVVYAGSEEALIAAFRRAQAGRTPLIGYFYAPQWLLSEIKLVHVRLPQYRPGCDSDPAKVACDYQPYDLDKIARKAFAESGSPAAELIKNFHWSDEDQNTVARDLTERKLSPDESAARWLDMHRSTWRPWLTP